MLNFIAMSLSIVCAISALLMGLDGSALGALSAIAISVALQTAFWLGVFDSESLF